MNSNVDTPKAAEGSHGKATSVTRKINENRLPMPDSIAITVLILFAAMVIAGWFDPMLPWVK